MAVNDRAVRYSVSSSSALANQDFDRPEDAARAFHQTDPVMLPTVTRITRDGQASTIAKTSVVSRDTGSVYEKSVSDEDPAFRRAYAAVGEQVRSSGDDLVTARANPVYQEVELQAMERTQAQDRPRAIVLGGQPGAGKSELAGEAIREMRTQGGAIVIDADRMREELPRYKQLMRDDPQNAADLTQREAGAWASQLRLTAIGGKRNLVIDGTMRDPENIRGMTERLRGQGYEVDARVMAVSSETSIMRARLRYEEQSAERGFGRFVNAEQHDQAYTAIPRSVEMLEREKLVDRISIYSAGQERVYQNRLEHGEWEHEPGAAGALDSERARLLTHAEQRDKVSALEEISTLAKLRTGQSDGEIEAKLVNARSQLTQFEQSPGYQRAAAFEHMAKGDALAKYPELDGAYAQLRDLRLSMDRSMNSVESEQSFSAARVQLSREIERGDIPAGSVTYAESKMVIDFAAAERGIKSVRDADDLQRNVRGEVAAVSSQHVLVKLSDDVAVRFERNRLDRQVEQGDKVSVKYRQDMSEVHEAGKEPKDFARDVGREYGH